MNPKDATQQGVSAEDQAAASIQAAEQQEQQAAVEKPEPTGPVDKRAAQMQALHDKRREEIDAANAADEESPEGRKPNAPAINSEHLVERDGKQYLKLKVDGQERLLPVDEAVRGYQKVEAADRRLQEAAQARKELERQAGIVAENQRRVQAELERLQKQPPAGAGADPAEHLEDAKRVIETLLDGDPEEAAEALAKVMAARNSGPTVDPEKLAVIAAQRVREEERREKWQREIDEGNQAFESEFPEIMRDPYLFDITNRRTEELQAEHPDWSPKQIILEAGKLTREWWGKQTNQSGEGAQGSQDRQERKRNLKPMPRSSDGRFQQTTGQPETQEEARRRRIEETRRARAG